ncbi:electron transport complex subunit RsxC [Denitromonas halophila]|uniref:Ion-translocating oxidoreductase complex subunit C n=1 Tax=Denitromonas halophila TaxID=1629404 RepID=A0A557QYS0_9RHOO|nr:electron transport complex subunit RsxC [Denitromonas halophila]TVO57996.1 electron transport complex subunit RsxC [Denitromonas halophila]
MIAGLFRFKGGIKPETHKNASAGSPIQIAPLPKQLIVPLRQSPRATAECIVVPGQKVLKGERIGLPDSPLSTAVHAPTSGTVVEITPHAMAHASGLQTRCVVIEPDGDERWIDRPTLDYASASPKEALAWLRDHGIVGLGGATFPSHIKAGVDGGIETLILNGAECEPWITCDDRLMRERADGIVAGALILKHLTGAREIVFGVEDNKPQAIEALRTAIHGLSGDITVIPVPSLYPAGGEKQLIRVLTGVEIPHGKLGGDFGVQCFNVGTAYAVNRAINHGEPLVSRVMTVTGNVDKPGNFEVLIGTPVEALLALGQPKPDTGRILMGGPMMGFELPRLDVPATKATNCLIATSPTLFPPPPPEMNCIRCGACAVVCPAELQPFELYWFSRARNFGKAQEYHLFDCIECGCCSYVCPSQIRLVDYYRFAKGEIWAREREKSAADAARERFEFRNERQAREKREKAEKLAAKAAATKAKLAAAPTDAPAAVATDTPAGPDDAKRALIAAALERAKAQKAAVEPKNTDALTPEQAAQVAEADARRAAQAAPDTAADAPESN